MAKWHYSVGAFSFHFFLDCSKLCLLSLPSAPTGIVSYCPLCQHLKPFSGHFLLQLSHPSFWAQPILLPVPQSVLNPTGSLPPCTIHPLSPWLCISALSSSLLFPPEVFELLKPFTFYTLPKTELLLLLRSFLPLVICHDCSFCLLSRLLPWGPFPCCLLINVCQCPPFPSPNHFLKAHLFYKMQPFESCSLGLVRSNSTLFDGMKPVQNQYNHCFHTWYSLHYPFFCNTKLCGADFRLCHRYPLRHWEAREEKWLDGFCASLIPWVCMGKSGCSWVTEVLHHMGHHPRHCNIFPSSLLLFQTRQSHSTAEKFKGCEFFPVQRPCAKQEFLSHGGSPRWSKLGSLWDEAWLLIFA